jgi:menaquinone-9 beta-reductase
LLAGHRVTGLLRESPRRHGAARVVGVEVQSAGGIRRLKAPLVIGADGRHSRIADLLAAPGRLVQNDRFAYFAYFEDVAFPGDCGHVWLLEPDVAYAFPTDGNRAILTVSPHRRALPEFRADLDGAFRRVFAGCPEGAHLAHARRVSDYRGMVDIPNISRPPVREGVALVGDAAIASDPIWGTGCGFALVSAEWLADEVAGPLLALRRQPGHRDLDRALARYRRRHDAELGAHQKMIESYSRARPHDWLERLMFRAAAEDQTIARQVDRIGGRLIRPERLLAPATLARMLWVNLRALLRPRRITAAASPNPEAPSPSSV